MKRNMLKTVALLVSLMLLLSVLPAAFAGENEVTQVVLWHSMSDAAGEMMAQFEKKFNETVGLEKGIHAVFQYQGAYADSVTKMNSILSGGKPEMLPDIMQLDATGKVTYATSGKAYTAGDAANDDPAFDLGVYLPAALNNWNFASVQLGVPFAASTTLMYYNKTLLDSLSMDVPHSFEDMAALREALDAQDHAATTVYAALVDTPSLANWLGQAGSYVVDMKNGSEGTASTLDCLENGALLRFMEAWKQLYASGALEDNAGSIDAFAAGDTLLYTASTSHISRLLSKIDGAFELGAAYYPKAFSDASFGATVSGSCLVMFDKGDEIRKAAAREVVLYLTGAESQAAFGAATGYIPCRADAMETEQYQELLANYPQYAVGVQQLTDTPADMCSVTVGPAKDFYYAIQDGCSAMLEDGLSPEEATQELADELQGLLDQYVSVNP